jgi:hypothetical protein
MDEKKGPVAFDGHGKPVANLKIKTAASQSFYLRVVRDVSFIDENDGVECRFADVANMRSFGVVLGKVALHVRLSNLYPLKPPTIVLLGEDKKCSRELAGKTRLLHFDETGKLCDADLVGKGWQPIRGIHHLLKVLSFEFGNGSKPAQDDWMFGGSGSHCDSKRFQTYLKIGDLSTVIVCEAFGVKPQVAPSAVDEPALSVKLAVSSFCEEHARDDENLESVLAAAISSAQISDAWIGVSVCVVCVSRTRVVSAHVGNVTCHLLRTNCRSARRITVPHDGFNEKELERVSGVQIVRHGATVRYFEDLTRVSRCLGLSQCEFVSAVPETNAVQLELGDSVLLVGSETICEAISPLEMASIFCPLTCAEEMASEAERISKHRGARDNRAFVILCL